MYERNEIRDTKSFLSDLPACIPHNIPNKSRDLPLVHITFYRFIIVCSNATCVGTVFERKNILHMYYYLNKIQNSSNIILLFL